MNDCCHTQNPLRRDGTSQPQRFPLPLAEDYVQIDERSYTDILNFIRHLAREFNYYNGGNVINGDWTSFFQDDLSFLLAQILKIDLDAYRTAFTAEYSIAQSELDSTSAPNVSANLPVLLERAIAFFLQDITVGGVTYPALPSLLDDWHGLLPPAEAFEGEDNLFSLKDEIGEMRGRLSRFTSQLQLAHYESENQLTGFPVIDSTWYSDLDSAWGVSSPPILGSPLTYYPQGDLHQGARDVLTLLRATYDTFIGILNQLISRIPDYMAQSLEHYASHHPSTGLFLAFVQLFQHAQQHLNTLGRKHLLYHYQDVLRFSRQPAVPDKAALIFQLRKGTERYVLEEGRLFKAGKDDGGNPLFYRNDREVALNQAVIDQIRTVHVEREEVNQDMVVRGIYAAPIANSADGIGGDLDGDEPKWSAFGEAQTRRPASERTMVDAELGFALASPLFQMKEGDRKVYLTFSLSRLRPGSTLPNPLLDVPNLGELAQVEADILHGLKAQFTGEKGWVDAKVGKVMVVRDASELAGHAESDANFGIAGRINDDDFVLAIRIDLDETGPSVVPFDQKLHGSGYDTLWPALRLSFDSQGNSVSELAIPRLIPGNAVSTQTRYLYEGVVYKPKQNGNLTQLSEFEEVSDFSELLAWKFPAFSAATTYNSSDRVFYSGKVYEARQAVPINKIPDEEPGYWREVRVLTSIYQHLEFAQPKQLAIKVAVKGVRGLNLENDLGRLKSTKPFEPFGPAPVVGSRFYLGYNEALGKRLESLDFSIQWQDAPIELEKHYAAYPGISKYANNDQWRARVAVLNKGLWETFGSSVPLFENHSATPPGQQGARQTRVFSYTAADFAGMDRELDLSEPGQLASDTARGYLRLEIATPNIAFGHGEYQNLYVNEGIRLAGLIADGDNPTGNFPNEPYTPTIKEIVLDYTSVEVLDFSATEKADYERRIEQFYHLHPFGHTEEHAYLSNEKIVRLVPYLPDEGYLYLGLKDLNPPLNAGVTLSMLFQLAEGSADPELERFAPVWSYLSHNQWVDLEPSEILFDSSNELLISGVVQFELGKAITQGNTLLDGNLHWMRARVAQNTAAIHKAIDLKAQALLVSFIDRGNTPGHLRTALPSGSITGLKVNQPEVKKIQQPYATFGGKLSEESDEFLTRVSERLRHKHRSINIWDYERMVLEQFPEVYKVKCLNHTEADSAISSGSDWEIAPGHVTVVTIPDLRNRNAVNPFEPKTALNTLDQIQAFLSEQVSAWVDLRVTNPLYEKILLDCKIGFVTGKDPGYYIGVLNDELKQFLSPWAFDQEEEIIFGGKVHRSVIINFIEHRDYVDFVVDFRMDQILSETEILVNVNEAVASTSRSILVSALDHTIIQVKPDEVNCIPVTPVPPTPTTDCCGNPLPPPPPVTVVDTGTGNDASTVDSGNDSQVTDPGSDDAVVVIGDPGDPGDTSDPGDPGDTGGSTVTIGSGISISNDADIRGDIYHAGNVDDLVTSSSGGGGTGGAANANQLVDAPNADNNPTTSQ
ncbi:MAG: hypothetical protein AAGN35_08450 [Bacteroidota bacterium]